MAHRDPASSLRYSARLAFFATAGVLALFAFSGCGPSATRPGAPAPTSEASASAGYPAAGQTSPSTLADAYPVHTRRAREAQSREAALAEAAAVDRLRIVEDWEAYRTAGELELGTQRNLGIGNNALTLRLEPSEEDGLPTRKTLVMIFDIQEAAPEDFVGFDRDLGATQDWTGSRAVGLWVSAQEPSEADLVFQFRELSGEVWRCQQPLPKGETFLVLSLDADTFRRTEWSPLQNGQIDLQAVDRYGLYVGHRGPAKAGTVRFGPIVRILETEP